jgi:hypothetical protein
MCWKAGCAIAAEVSLGISNEGPDESLGGRS